MATAPTGAIAAAASTGPLAAAAPSEATAATVASAAISTTAATLLPATDRCKHCGITYRTSDGHTCAISALRPELVSTVNPDDTAPIDPCGDTVPPPTPPALPTPPDPPADDLLGTLINDRFEIQRCLSKGGMGIVYLARHRALDTQVAIKVLLRPRGGDDQERFLLEAKIASKVRHPNTVYISDFGQLADGRNYLAMEFLRGRPLSDEVDRGPLPLVRALRIAVQIARGLRAVHDCGIVHRDIKPANVLLVEQDGNTDFVKIVDFGIAEVRLAPHDGESPTAGPCGTPAARCARPRHGRRPNPTGKLTAKKGPRCSDRKILGTFRTHLLLMNFTRLFCFEEGSKEILHVRAPDRYREVVQRRKRLRLHHSARRG